MARLAYNDNFVLGFGGGRGRGGGSWTTDVPDAEYHLTQGIRRLTRINTIDPERVGDGVVLPVRPMDEDLFDYPFLYAVEVGRWSLDDAEAARAARIPAARRLPDGRRLPRQRAVGSASWIPCGGCSPTARSWRSPMTTRSSMCSTTWTRKCRSPESIALMTGRTYEQDGVDPHWRGVFDDNGRLMVAINFNMDLGDAWEHADDPEYPAAADRAGLSLRHQLRPLRDESLTLIDVEFLLGHSIWAFRSGELAFARGWPMWLLFCAGRRWASRPSSSRCCAGASWNVVQRGVIGAAAVRVPGAGAGAAVAAGAERRARSAIARTWSPC